MGRRWGTSLGGRRLLGRSVEGPPGGVRSRKGGDGWPGFEVRLTWWVRLKDAVKRGKDQERRREYALCWFRACAWAKSAFCLRGHVCFLSK